MKIYVLIFFACCSSHNWCASYQETATTQYGTFVLSEPQAHDILDRIIIVTSCAFSEMSVPNILNATEKTLFQAYISAKDPKQQLLHIAAEARTHNWHPSYIKAINTLLSLASKVS